MQVPKECLHQICIQTGLLHTTTQMAKKRSQRMSPSLAEAPTQKKIKTTNGTLDDEHADDGWTKVEKRKQKKIKKARVDVRLSYPHDVSLLTDIQATQPRFMYNNAEIVKRNHAVGIDVCVEGYLLHFVNLISHA